jgi:hypothetical protein
LAEWNLTQTAHFEKIDEAGGIEAPSVLSLPGFKWMVRRISQRASWLVFIAILTSSCRLICHLDMLPMIEDVHAGAMDLAAVAGATVTKRPQTFNAVAGCERF